MKKALIFTAIAAIFSGCSTDIDVNAPYRNIHVMYGLLNMADSIQFIKVNKAFLGEGDALLYAQIPDSNELNGELITSKMVYRLNTNGQRIASFELKDTVITDREPGVFFGPDQQMFYFKDQEYQLAGNAISYLDQNSEYEIEFTVRGETLRARTTIVNDISLGMGSPLSANDINLYSPTIGYVTPELRWSTAIDGKRYQLLYRFKYTEIRGSDVQQKEIVRTIGTTVAPNSQSAGQLGLAFDGGQFYRAIAEAVPVDPTVDQRIFTGLDFIFTVANDEFHTYLTLSEPVTGIVQDRIEYSNVENGYGIFGSRYTKTYNRFMNGSSLTELANGPITGHLGFCYQQPGDEVQCP